MSDLLREAIEAARKAHDGPHPIHRPVRMEAAIRAFLDASDFVSLADVTEAYRDYENRTYADRRERRMTFGDFLRERFGKSAPPVTPEDSDWRCECGDLNRDHEAFCYRCGAGHPRGHESTPEGEQR